MLQHADVPLRLSFRRFDDGSREPFDETRVGLDHVALGVVGESDLDAWQQRLERAGIECNRAELPELSIVVFRDPDNIQIELCTPMKLADGRG